MEVKSSVFVKSSKDVNHCPTGNYPEYAFIGRSNVGKSSLLNMLTIKKKLAKVSSTPGKTQLINHFLINEKSDPWYMADLPGYGYAKVPKKEKKKWMQFIKIYLTSRANLSCVIVLLDCRHNPQKIDLEFMEWLSSKGLPFIMVFTKIDKLGSAQLAKSLKTYKMKMLNKWEFLPGIYTTSSSSNLGRESVLEFIEDTNVVWRNIPGNVKA